MYRPGVSIGPLILTLFTSDRLIPMGKNAMKTHKGLKARVRVTKTGKVLHRRSGKSHLMSGKSGKKVRQLRRKAQVSAGDRRVLKRQYGVG